MAHELDFWAVATVLAALALVWFAMDRSRSKSRAQFRLYSSAAETLNAHYDAMERFVEDPASPRIAIETLLAISEISANRQDAKQFAECLCMPDSKSNGHTAFREEMARLRKTRPDLAETFDSAVGNGLLALFLRWPETAPMIPKYLSSLNNQRKKQDASIAAERYWSEHKKTKPDNQIHGLPVGA